MSIGRHVVNADLASWGLGEWWIAHEYPERPVDGWTVWSWDCDACMIHLVASAHHDGDLYAEEFKTHSMFATTVAETLAQARAWRVEHGLRAL